MVIGEDYIEEELDQIHGKPEERDYETRNSLRNYSDYGNKTPITTAAPTVKGNSSAARVDALKIRQAVEDEKVKEITKDSGTFQALGIHTD